MDYVRLTGGEAMMDPDDQPAGLSLQQQAELPGLREAESQAYWDAADAREQRFQASQERAEALMETPFA